MKFCVTNRAKVERILFKVREGLEEQAGLSKEYRFWSAHFAIPIAALYICQKYLNVLQGFSVDALFDFILALAKKQKQDLSEWVMQPVDILHHMITKLSGGIIVTNGEKDGRNGALDTVSLGGMEPIGRIVRDSGNLFLSVRAVRDWCSAHRVQYTTMKTTMEEQGVLLGTKRYYIGKGTSIPTGQEYCLHLDWNRLQKVGTTIGETVVNLRAVK